MSCQLGIGSVTLSHLSRLYTQMAGNIAAHSQLWFRLTGCGRKHLGQAMDRRRARAARQLYSDVVALSDAQRIFQFDAQIQAVLLTLI